MSTTILYIFGYSLGECIHKTITSCVPHNICITNQESVSGGVWCPGCCTNNYICSLVVSCGRGCYDGCVGNVSDINISN